MDLPLVFDLEYFFQQWIYGENYPVYDVLWGYSPNAENTYDVTVSIKQDTNTEPSFFTMPVDLKFTGEKDTTITIWNDIASHKIQFVLDFEPTQLIFDPDNWILKDISIF